MTFKYYFYSILVSFFLQPASYKLKKKHVLSTINFITIGLIYFLTKKHFMFLLLHITLIFFTCQFLQNSKNKIFTAAISIIFAFLPLVFFKYTFSQNLIIQYFPFSSSLLKPSVFLGISFYTFRISSLVIDILYGRIKEKVSFVDVFSFALFFPSLLSGPLDRYSRFVSDLENDIAVTWQERYNAIYRITWGVFKKLVISDILWNFSNDSYNTIELGQIKTWKILLGQYAYYLVLYFDFSGYSDIAIGTGQLFGIQTPENFNTPWKARNIQIFWNSWHISFMNWLRDYVFYPLQTFLLRMGLKSIPLNNSISYFLVFLIAGLWHGEKINFFYYGVFHGVGFVIFFVYKRALEKFLNKDQRKMYMKNKYIEIFSIFVTFHFFLISLFFFIDKQEFFKIIFNRVVYHAQ